MDNKILFTTSLSAENHPMTNKSTYFKIKYCSVLKHFIMQTTNNNFVKERLNRVCSGLLNYTLQQKMFKSNMKNNIQFILIMREWRLCLICDIALILIDENDIKTAIDNVKPYLNQNKIKQINILLKVLKNNSDIEQSLFFLKNMIYQYRKNREFINKKELRIIVTANMSAGKSTLINALIGKSISCMSQEVCTGNICYLYNKPYDDRHTHLLNQHLKFDASEEDLKSLNWKKESFIASKWNLLQELPVRICIIDTPGVNSSINLNHGTTTRNAIKKQTYDKLIYVLNANKLGTDEEIRHLKWISDNVENDKIIFVLNKLDTFKSSDDSIEESINGVRSDLNKLGYQNPVICPLSAYAALLAKLKQTGVALTEDEEDEYDFLEKKFQKDAYDLSRFYENPKEHESNTEIASISRKCGIYDLEKIILGGII